MDRSDLRPGGRAPAVRIPALAFLETALAPRRLGVHDYPRVAMRTDGDAPGSGSDRRPSPRATAVASPARRRTSRSAKADRLGPLFERRPQQGQWRPLHPCATRPMGYDVFPRYPRRRTAGRMTATRRLAAILSVDIAGYSRLKGRFRLNPLPSPCLRRRSGFHPMQSFMGAVPPSAVAENSQCSDRDDASERVDIFRSQDICTAFVQAYHGCQSPIPFLSSGQIVLRRMI